MSTVTAVDPHWLAELGGKTVSFRVCVSPKLMIVRQASSSLCESKTLVTVKRTSRAANSTFDQRLRVRANNLP